MKLIPVWKEALRLYKKNFPQLCLALLVELVLRAIALSSLLFLVDKALAPLAYIAIPLYILIVLPARQNYALALQHMMNGGNVFHVGLLSVDRYFTKLLHGLLSTIYMLLWSTVTLVSMALLYAALNGLVDVITLMRIFASIGGDFITGVMVVMGGIAASTLLILLGCGVHSGSRHANALGDRKLLKGNRLRLTALWFTGLVLVIPFAVVVVAAMGDYAMTLINEFKATMQFPTFTLNGRQIAMLGGGALVLLFPLLPLKSLLPAVYLRMAKEKKDAQA